MKQFSTKKSKADVRVSSFVDKTLFRSTELVRQPAPATVTLRDIDEIISDLNGRLFLAGWVSLLWRLNPEK